MSSACKAPACFMVSKMVIMSRGVTPRAFRAAATFSTVGNSGRVTMLDFFSVTSVVVPGVTAVRPRLLKAFGCDTFSVEATLMVMLPWATAQLEMWMFAVATMVPVRSLMMMRAGVFGVT